MYSWHSRLHWLHDTCMKMCKMERKVDNIKWHAMGNYIITQKATRKTSNTTESKNRFWQYFSKRYSQHSCTSTTLTHGNHHIICTYTTPDCIHTKFGFFFCLNCATCNFTNPAIWNYLEKPDPWQIQPFALYITQVSNTHRRLVGYCCFHYMSCDYFCLWLASWSRQLWPLLTLDCQ